MIEMTLPQNLLGDWIWLSKPVDETDKYCFFRHDFKLDETPGDAMIYIAACTSFHIYVNGRHVYYGESSLCKDKTYVHALDVAYCLEPGKNLICVVVHNSSLSSYASYCHRWGGMWLQMEIEGRFAFATDENWRVTAPDCYSIYELQHSSKGAFTEQFDFNLLPHEWLHAEEFNLLEWSHPDVIVPIDKQIPFFAERVLSGITCEDNFFSEEIVTGTVSREFYSTVVEYSDIMTKPGAYMAESFFYSEVDSTLDCQIFSDTVYKLFVNNELVKEQGQSKLTNGDIADVNNRTGSVLKQFVKPEFELRVKEGWNRIVLAQRLEISSYGFTLNMNMAPGQISLQRSSYQDSLPGWSIAGPLRTPLANIPSNVVLPDLKTSTFISSKPIDESAYHETLIFTRDNSPVVDDLRSFYLQEGAYVIVDLDTTSYALPQCYFEGHKGDVIDVVYGEHIVDGRVPSFDSSRGRNAESVTLAGKREYWMRFKPHGMRYVMLYARRAKEPIYVTDLKIRVVNHEYGNEGIFESNDMALNDIWKLSQKTLASSLGFNFMDSPCREKSQYLGEAMVQALSAFYLRGDYVASAKALEEFAAIQYETGEIPAMHPDDIYFNILDCSLLFPVWLQKHFMFTGDSAFLDKMIPAMRRLFRYIESYNPENSDIIYLSGPNAELECYIDYAPVDKRGIVTGLNAIYCRALLSGASLLDEIGEEDEAVIYRNKASKIANAIRELCWNEKKGLFADCWVDGSSADTFALQSNILTIYGGIALPEQREKILEAFLPGVGFDYLGDEYYTPYFQYFVLETLFAIGETLKGVNVLKDFWGGMLDYEAKTWPELYGPNKDVPFGGSSSMGSGTSPAYFIIQELVGIRPAAPGYQVVYFNPCLRALPNVKATVPTPAGNIHVYWVTEGNITTIDLESSHALTVIPQLTMDYECEINFNISDSITVVEG